MKERLLTLLNIRPGEERTVQNLFIIEFFQGASIAFFFTAAFSLFLTTYSIHVLPEVFIAAAILSWFTGFAYARVEHNIPIKKLGVVMTLVMAFSIIAFRIGAVFFNVHWLWFAMLCWFYVLYLINNLEFWGIASVIFDVRQSKRLFGVISAGDIPAKLVGYSLATAIVEFIKPEDLLYVSFGCMLLSLPFVRRIARINLGDMNVHEGHHDAQHKPQVVTGRKKIQLIIKNFTENRLVERIAILSLLFSLCFFIINFELYSKVKIAYHDNVEMAQFIGIFFATSRVLALILKIVFTGRLVSFWGYRNCLLIMPVLLFVLVGVLLYMSNAGYSDTVLIYVLAVMAISAEALSSSIYSPVFLAMMQPLPTHERLRAHNIVKGIMSPVALILAGICLSILVGVDYARVNVIGILLLIVVFFWIINIINIMPSYLQTLFHSIARRNFATGEMTVTDKESLDVIETKLKTGTTIEKMYVLDILRHQTLTPEIEQLLLAATTNDDATVQEEAIGIVASKNINNAGDVFEQVITTNQQPQVVAKAIEAYASLNQPNLALVANFTLHENIIIKAAAIKSSIFNGDEDAQAKALLALQQLINSPAAEERRYAAKVISALDAKYAETLVPLMFDKEPAVAKQAILGAGHIKDKQLIEKLFQFLPAQVNEVLYALEIGGDVSVEAIKKFIEANAADEETAIQLLKVLGRINTSTACNALIHLLVSQPQHSNTIIKILYRKNQHFNGEEEQVIHSVIRHYLEFGARNIHCVHVLVQTQQFIHTLKAIDLEIEEAAEAVFYLFSLLYLKNKTEEIKQGLQSRKKERRANAMELIEVMVPPNFSLPYMRMAEHVHRLENHKHNTEHHPHAATNHQKQQTSAIINEILGNKEKKHNVWTLACCLYEGIKNNTDFSSIALKKYIDSENLMLREIALSYVTISR